MRQQRGSNRVARGQQGGSNGATRGQQWGSNGAATIKSVGHQNHQEHTPAICHAYSCDEQAAVHSPPGSWVK
jgi:hypothetical protein